MDELDMPPPVAMDDGAMGMPFAAVPLGMVEEDIIGVAEDIIGIPDPVAEDMPADPDTPVADDIMLAPVPELADIIAEDIPADPAALPAIIEEEDDIMLDAGAETMLIPEAGA